MCAPRLAADRARACRFDYIEAKCETYRLSLRETDYSSPDNSAIPHPRGSWFYLKRERERERERKSKRKRAEDTKMWRGVVDSLLLNHNAKWRGRGTSTSLIRVVIYQWQRCSVNAICRFYWCKFGFAVCHNCKRASESLLSSPCHRVWLCL